MLEYFLQFFSIYKNANRILSKKKPKKSFQKRFLKGIEIFLMKKKTKSVNMLVSDIEIFLKKKNKRSINTI